MVENQENFELPPSALYNQRTAAWFDARLGHLTASRLGDALARTKSGWGAARHKYALELVAARLTGHTRPSYVSSAMEWGIAQEDAAKDWYIRNSDEACSECGFFPHPEIPWAGASPDLLVGSDCVAEFKCLTAPNHVRMLLGDPIDENHRLQVLWQLECTGRSRGEIVFFAPDFPERLRAKKVLVEPTELEFSSLRKEVLEFLKEVDEICEKLNCEHAEPDENTTYESGK